MWKWKPSPKPPRSTRSWPAESISGDYHQSAAAQLHAQLGTRNPALAINGTATLNGLLQCALPPGFAASAGDRFQIRYSTGKVELEKM